jgi:XTP/dITP diphosphohydrolase
VKTVYYVTKNDGKYKEVKGILASHGIVMHHIKDEKPELQDEDLEKIAAYASKELATRHGKAIVTEDTGIFFDAYPGFPGPFTKFVYQSLGFKGLFKLLDGMPRKAYFRTVVGFCEPGKEPMLFDGILKGTIAGKPIEGGHDSLPYDQIFIPDGYTVPLSMMMEKKQEISHRKLAFSKFARYMNR